MPKKEEKLTLGDKEKAIVRMYGQGFGDCFLLAFPRKEKGGHKNPVYVVIDSGVYQQTPGESERMKAVAENISEATGGVIDLLVATHEHYDHLSGFNKAKGVWKKIDVKQIWLAWTENMKDPQAKKYQKDLEGQAEIIEKAKKIAEKQPSLAQELNRIQKLADFATAGQLKAPVGWASSTDRVLDAFAQSPGNIFRNSYQTEIEFCEPGQVLTVQETNVDAFVLGPPRDESALSNELDTDVYSDKKLKVTGLALRRKLAAASDRAERESLGSAILRHWSLANGAAPAKVKDENMPFRASMSISYTDARKVPFFQDHYFKGSYDRQIEDNWLYGFGRFALQVDEAVNNTSLVLAFRLPDGGVLLFPGDAQGGNWRSWFDIREWKRRGEGKKEFKPRAADLIKRTVVYKVGHHGSHNATLRKEGLEQMPDGVIAFVPVSRSYPQVDKHWSIPLPSLVEALKRKTGGRLVFPDAERSRRDGLEKKYKPEATFESAVKTFEDDKKLPLWRQVRI